MPDDAELWKDCYQSVQLLTPKAAKLAARMLSKDPHVPTNWAFSLDVALTSRAKGAGPITQADLEVIAASQRSAPSETQFDEDHRQAWQFAASIRASSIEARSPAKGHQRSTNPDAPQELVWDPRTLTPEEKWLLAFSDEFHRLADDRVDADDVAKCAMKRLETDGHRNPVAVAREQFIAGRDGALAADSFGGATASR
jgi:hypothetical protein